MLPEQKIYHQVDFIQCILKSFQNLKELTYTTPKKVNEKFIIQ